MAADADDAPLTLASMAAYLAEGCKPASEFRVGAEHEKFPFRTGSLDPIPYEPAGIRDLLEGLQRYGWAPVTEHGHLIALTRGGASVSLEPAGQFELSGAPFETLHDVADETAEHLVEAKTVAAELGVGFLAMGMTPTWSRDDVSIMPKGRYDIMRAYMPT
ncbi:MAG: glutamate-cysteine ligase family protein, partial [Caulobacteraceae bacterium]